MTQTGMKRRVLCNFERPKMSLNYVLVVFAAAFIFFVFLQLIAVADELISASFHVFVPPTRSSVSGIQLEPK